MKKVVENIQKHLSSSQSYQELSKDVKMVDEKDKLILFELLQDCRQPISKIAKAVKLPQQTTSYRIRKMEKDGSIIKYSINVDYQKLGMSRHSLYLDINGVDAKSVEKYLGSISKIDEVSCCYTLHNMSRWKIYISIWTRDIERYDDIQTLIVSKFKNHINNYLSFQSVKSYTYLARGLNPKKKAKVDVKGKVDNIQLKNIDWKIIAELKKNSKIIIIDLAQKLKSSTKIVKGRVDFLKRKEIIQRFYPVLNLKKIGTPEYNFISRIDPSFQKELEEFMNLAKNDSRFTIIIKAVGYVNLYYSFIAKDNKEYGEITHKIEKIFGKGILEVHKIINENIIN